MSQLITPSLSYAQPDTPIQNSLTPAAHLFFLQTAHRAISVGIWVAVAKIGLDFWSRPFPFAAHLMPAAFILFTFAAIISHIVYWTAQDRPAARDESAGLFRACAGLLALTFLFLPQLASSTIAAIVHLLQVMHII